MNENAAGGGAALIANSVVGWTVGKFLDSAMPQFQIDPAACAAVGAACGVMGFAIGRGCGPVLKGLAFRRSLAEAFAEMPTKRKAMAARALDDGFVEASVLDPDAKALQAAGVLMDQPKGPTAMRTEFSISPKAAKLMRKHRREWLGM